MAKLYYARKKIDSEMRYVNTQDKTAPGEISGVEDSSLGSHIRSLRKAHSLTLQTLSVASGVSRAALSKIERGEMSPTYDSLCKIARGFSIDIVQLLNKEWTSKSPSYAVTRKGGGVPYITERYEHHLSQQGFECARMRAFSTSVSARDMSEYEEPDIHDTEDIITVLKGIIQITLDEKESILLEQGDVIHMDSNISHSIISVPSSAPNVKSKKNFEDAEIFWVSLGKN